MVAASNTDNQGADRRPWPRVLFHSVLCLAFGALSASVLVWPNWAAADKSRTTLEIVRERETTITDQLDLARAMAERLRDWKQDGRRVFLEEELPLYPALVRQAVQQTGVKLEAVEVTRRATNRFRPLRVPSSALGDDEGGEEIQPRAVRIVLRGSFDAVYRTIAMLGQQQQLFVPERWDIGAGGGGELRADLWATIFVVKGAGETMKPVPAPQPPAAKSVQGPPAAQPAVQDAAK